MNIALDGKSLSLGDVSRVCRRMDGAYPTISLDEAAREKLLRTRRFIEREWMGDDMPLRRGSGLV